MNQRIQDLDLGRFSDSIDKSLLKLNEDGTYDYKGNLDFTEMNLNSLEEIPIRFYEVKGYFSCDKNNLISLQYAPSYVSRNFWCNDNNLLSTVRKSKIGFALWFDNNPFEITDKVIETIKKMTEEQRASELKFFKEHDSNAYKMMKKILNENNLKGEEFQMCYTIK